MRTNLIRLRRSLLFRRRGSPLSSWSFGRRAALRPRHVDRARDVLSGHRPDCGRAAPSRSGSSRRSTATRSQAHQSVRRRRIATGRKPLVGRDGSDPAGFFRIATPGLLVIGYRSNPSAIEQTADKFNQIPEGRRARGRRRTASSAQTRPAPKLASSFPGAPRACCFPGHRARHRAIVRSASRSNWSPSENPYALNAGQEMPVRLIYENRPLAGALVVAMNRLHPSEKLTARTDEAGRARFKLHQNGMWLIKAVHMVPAPADAHAEWESFWASLTFEIPVTANG